MTAPAPVQRVGGGRHLCGRQLQLLAQPLHHAATACRAVISVREEVQSASNEQPAACGVHLLHISCRPPVCRPNCRARPAPSHYPPACRQKWLKASRKSGM